MTIAAIILGPILAVQAQKFIERKREQKNRRLSIFKTLMATRGTVLSTTHVEALNRIDLEFSDNTNFSEVIIAWKEYFDNLLQKADTQEQLIVWNAKNEELLANLLFEMGISLGYKFDKVLIKRNIYSPVGYWKIERENELIRQGLLKLLQGSSNFPTSINHIELSEEAVQRQSDLQKLMMKYYKQQIEGDNNSMTNKDS